MSVKDNKQDSEVYVLGSDGQVGAKKKGASKKWLITAALLAVALGILLLVLFSKKEQEPEYYFEPESAAPQSIVLPKDSTSTEKSQGFTEVKQEQVNDVPLKIYIPHKAAMSLQLGLPNVHDSAIIFAAMAADIRKDNQEIVGDFVLNGERLSRGVSKKGFCAIDGDVVTIGVGETTPLLQQMISSKGSFFRQYPLVCNGELVENKPKNKAIRRALAIQNERVVMVESANAESFHDFSQALIDIGVTDAIYLVGANAYGWYRDENHTKQEFGKELAELPVNLSYIVWRVR